MKTFIYLIFFFLICSTLIAQTETCISDDVLGEDPTSCCNDLIRTAPIDPVNTEYPALLNQFDWLAPTANLPSPNILEVDIGNGVVNAKHPFLVDNTNYYWFSSFRSGQTFPLETHNMHPKYGWELMHMNLGLGLYGDGQTSGQPNPYMLFYNKYSGKLRMLISPSSAVTSFDNANVDLSVITPTFSNGLDASALLNRYNGQQKALDQETVTNKVSSNLPFTDLNNWSVADFQLAYDPCTCNLPSRIAFEFTERDFSQVTMTGRLVGTIVPLGKSGNSPLNFGDDFLSSVLVDGFSEENKDNVGMLVYNQIAQDVESAYVSDGMKLLSSALSLAGGSIKGATVNLSLFPGSTDSIAVPVGSFGSAAAAFASKLLNPSAPNISYLEAEVAMSGTIEDVSNSSSFANFELLSPGSFVANHSAVAWDLHPFYNELPGLFALLKTPAMQFANTHGGTSTNNPTVEQDGGLLMAIEDPLEYVLNPAAEIDLETTEIYAAIEFDVYFPSVEMSNAPSYSEALSPSFTLADIEYIENSQIIDRFPMLGGLIVPNSNLAFLYEPEETGTKLTFQTAYVPIDKIDELRFDERFDFLDINHYSTIGTFSISDHQELFNFRLKILADYKFMPNGYGETNESVQVYTYEFGDVNEVPFFNVYECEDYPDNPICDTELYNQYDIQGDITINTTNYTASEDIYAETITIIGDLTTNNGVEINLFASNEIIVLDGGTVAPNINLIIRDPYPHEGINSVSEVDLKAFCESDDYKAGVSNIGEGTQNEEAIVDVNTNDIIFDLYPNPVNEALNFYLELEADANITTRLIDLNGKELSAFLLNENWIRGEYLQQFQTETLPDGLYLFEICVDGKCTSKKISIMH